MQPLLLTRQNAQLLTTSERQYNFYLVPYHNVPFQHAKFHEGTFLHSCAGKGLKQDFARLGRLHCTFLCNKKASQSDAYNLLAGGGGREGWGTEVNKFEQVSSDGQQMSLAVGSMYSEVPSVWGGGGQGLGQRVPVV